MSNHISAKFFSIIYARVTPQKFSDSIPALIEKLRSNFPLHETPQVIDFQFKVDHENVSAQKPGEVHHELHMVDASGLWGIRIGNSGVSFSISGYESYEKALPFVKSVVEIISDVLQVTHFSRVSLRNINLFEPTEENDNRFQDIADDSYWGRQEFPTLQNDFSCNGASTRHEYLSADWKTCIHVASGVVMRGQSFIPQDEWQVWKLRGKIPVQNDYSAVLLIDISAIKFEAPRNDPQKQNNVSKYSWDLIESSFDELHASINSVYKDITVKD